VRRCTPRTPRPQRPSWPAPAHRGRALSIILGGLTVGTVFGVPVGTWIGQHLSWPASLIFVAAVGAVALLGVLSVLPALPIPPAVPLA
jgi:predicted MFS family arabinose efflux permease